MAKADTAFATIEKPVAADAALEVGAKSDMIIVNVVVADEKGTPKEGATPAIIVIQGGGKTTLAKTMDGKKLARWQLSDGRGRRREERFDLLKIQ